MNGNYAFCLIWQCGCILSKRALAVSAANSALKCLICQEQYELDDLIPLNSTDSKEKEDNIEETTDEHEDIRSLKRKSKSSISLQADPKKSAVYKSLFNTCNDAKRHKSAHWVTYNPLYF
ncbi:hypothetical protein GJ496_007967 [Pomphorhynchus laevis]|nr:hypothetical protein GJ496_007967 [Pomphorhynchus laevis]